jgi:multidrug efflux pump subunit AcrB
MALSNKSVWSPMSWVVIGGLGFSTMLTLILVPVFYQQFSSKKTKVVVPLKGKN